MWQSMDTSLPKPSAILFWPQPSRLARVDLRRIGRATSARDHHRLAERRTEIKFRWARDGDWLTAGALFVYLGDASLYLEDYDEAHDCYQSARLRFHTQVDSRQRQNEAAACYGLALSDFMRLNFDAGLEQLSLALDLLDKAEKHWVSIYAAYGSAERCATHAQRLDDLFETVGRELAP